MALTQNTSNVITDGCNNDKPVVDNSLIECGGNYKEQECVIIRGGLPFIGVLPNSNIGEVIIALVDKLVLIDAEIKRLKQILDNNGIN